MKPIFLVMAILTTTFPFQAFSSENNWGISSSRDEMTGDFSAYASSPRTKPSKAMRFPYNDVSSWVGVGCNSDSFWVYLGFSEEPNISKDETRDGYNYISTRMKWDDEIVNEGLSQEWGSRFIHFKNDRETLEKIKSSKKLKVELNWYSHGRQYFDYDLSNSGSYIDEILDKCSLSINESSELKQIVRVEPKNPLKAYKENLEGWVSLSFDVNKKGDVDNILVLDSSHKRVFDREAIRALKKWKYKPKMVDGLPKESIGLTEVLEFKLNNKKR